MLDLVLVKASEGLRVPLRLRVTHSTELEGRDYEVGGTFEQPLTPTQVKLLSTAALNDR
jgi:hypothetical protein